MSPDLADGAPGRRGTLNDPAVVRRLLEARGARWAVVGLSANPTRVAYRIGRFVKDDLGMDVVAVHPRREAVHGCPAYGSLGEVPGPVDVVDFFVRSERVGPIVDEAIAAGAKALWLQLKVVDEEAAERAVAAGLDVVMDRCPAIEAPRLGIV